MIPAKFARLSMYWCCVVTLGFLVVPQVANAQWHATVGAQSHDKGHQALAFLPNELWIHAGDTVTWKFVTDEIHTVTFLKNGQVRPPFAAGCPGFSGSPASFDGSTCVTTPPMVKAATFTVSFPNAGNFKLVCLVHQDMTATVHVLKLSEALPHHQDFYDDEAEDEAEALLSDRDHSADDEGHFAANQVAAGRGEVGANGGGLQTLSVVRFRHGKTVIHAGQTVEWTNLDPATPHTVTFGAEPANPIPPSANVSMDTDGARHGVINSTADSVHSGFIAAAPQERIGLAQAPLSVTRFRVTFTKAGVYDYICVLHDDLGMKGQIVVLP